MSSDIGVWPSNVAVEDAISVCAAVNGKESFICANQDASWTGLGVQVVEPGSVGLLEKSGRVEALPPGRWKLERNASWLFSVALALPEPIIHGELSIVRVPPGKLGTAREKLSNVLLGRGLHVYNSKHFAFERLVSEKVTCTVSKGRAGEKLCVATIPRAARLAEVKNEIMQATGVHTMEQELSMDGELLSDGSAQPLLGAPDSKALALKQVELSASTIVEHLVKDDVELQQSALKWLGGLDQSRSAATAPYVIEPLSDISLPQSTREVAVQALIELGAPAAANVLPLLDSRDMFVRKAAVQVLGSFKEKGTQYIPHITYYLHDEDLGMQQTAIAAMGNLGKAAIPYSTELTAFLEGTDRELKLSALKALGDMGEDAAVHADEVLDLVRRQDDKGQFLKESDFELWKTALQTYFQFTKRELKIVSCNIDSVDDVSAASALLGKLGNLEELVLHDNKGFGTCDGSQVFSETALPALKNLKKLDLSCCGICDVASVKVLALGLAQLQTLELLDLSRNIGLGNPECAGILARAALPELRSLRSLHLRACGLKDSESVVALAPGLAKVTGCEVLVLQGNSAFGSAKGAQLLARDILPCLARLQSLDISACNLHTTDAVNALGPGLASLAVLKVLKLGGHFNEQMSNTGFGCLAGAKVLADTVLPKLPKLEVLDMSHCGPQDAEAAKVLAPGLGCAGSILELSLFQNLGFGIVDASNLFSGSVLQKLRGLRALDLHSCGFDTIDAVQAVAQGLCQLEQLEKLVIAGNPGFGTEGGAVLLAEEVLPGLQHLKTLDLSACEFQDEVLVRQLIVGISQLKELESLCACYNLGFSDPECVQALVSTAMALRELREIDLRFCGNCFGAITANDRDLLQAAAPANCFVMC